MFKLKIITTIPNLKVKLWNGHFEMVAEKIIYGALIPHYSNNQMDVFSRENSIEVELPKGLYQMRLSLPYFNPITENRETGTEFDMPLLMDEFITMNKDKEYRFDCVLEGTGYKRNINRKQVNETTEKI